MRRAAGAPSLVAFLLGVLLAAPAPAPPVRDWDAELQDAALDGPPKGWPDDIELPDLPKAPPPSGALPEPTLSEPFEIGEALYDPGRAADGAVSLLELMGVPIGDGEGRWLRPGRPKGGAPFHFTEPEARAFVARAVASARLAAESGEPVLTFADLHRAVAPDLPGWSAERLAAAYQQAYERSPEAIAPLVMLGQPIVPETPLLYPQLWLLLVDGFAPPAGTPRPGQPTPARVQASGGPAWGTGAQLLPPLNASWAIYWAPHIGHWIHQNGPEVQPATPRAHEGHGGPGRPVTLVASFPNAPQPIRAPNGQVLVDIRRPPALAGLTMAFTASSSDVGKFLEHGSFSTYLDSPQSSDASGSIRNVYTPKPETADGQGDLMRDSARIAARVKASEMADALFHMTPQLGAWLFPDADVEGQPRNFGLEWHELESIDLYIENTYNVRLPLGTVGKAQRKGRDVVFGRMARREDGTWYGLLTGMVLGRFQVVEGFGIQCNSGGLVASQDLHVTGTMIADFGPTHPDATYDFPPATPGGPRRRPGDFVEKLSLEFVPASPPSYLLGPNRCWPSIPTPLTPDPFIPFNDAQWTIEHAGYGIALPEEGKLAYTEKGGAAGAGLGGPAGPGNPLGPGLGQLLSKFGTSTWRVKVERRKPKP